MTDQGKKYFAFISYQRKDVKWADWLRRKLEHYRLPSSLRKQNASLPKEIRPVFRDMLELAGGLLTEEIHDALLQSRYLIVICSPRSAQSPWVDKEVKTFIELGRARDIIQFIIEGKPFSDNPDTECFTPALRSLKGDDELLGIDINEMGRDAAAVKVVASMFDLLFDMLWQRYERERRWRRAIAMGLSLLALTIGFYLSHLNRTVVGQNEVISIFQDQMSRVSDRWIGLIQEDDSLYQAKSMELLKSAIDNGASMQLLGVRSLMRSTYDTWQDSMDVVAGDDSTYVINGLRFVTENPSDEDLQEWITASSDTCLQYVSERTDRYTISPMMIDNDPCLAYLIMNSRSIGTDSERQDWFDLYSLMNQEQVMHLYGILYRERCVMAGIKIKYEKRDAEMIQKYSEVMSEYQSFRQLARKYPKYFFDVYTELQDKILGVYINSSTTQKGQFTYEMLLTEALEDCEARYRKDPSCKNRLASLKIRMGAFRMNRGQDTEAETLFESAYELDPDLSASYLAEAYNRIAYKYANNGDNHIALDYIEMALEIQPDEANYYDSKGEFLMENGDWAGAREMKDKVLELDPDFLSKHPDGTPLFNLLQAREAIEQDDDFNFVYEVDGLVFSTPNPTTDFLMKWVDDSKAICANLIQGKTTRFSVPQSMIDEHPVLVYLVLNSESLSTDIFKQEWFDLYDLMDESQIMELYGILYRETYKLKDIERKYQQKQIEIDNKYFELFPDSGSSTTVTMDPSNDLETLEDVYEVDGLVFSTPNPTTDFLMKWVKDSKAICANLIQGKTTRFSVSKRMIDKHPVLVYLVLNSKSISSKKEKQGWFDLYDSMDESQIMQLYDILYRETYKLEVIERYHQQKQTELYEKYPDLYPNL